MKHSFVRVFIISSIFLLLIMGCNEDNDEKQGSLPTFAIGDTWTARATEEDASYTMVHKVIGEDIIDGTECYVMEALVEPPVEGLNKVLAYMDKSTLDPIKSQMSGESMGNLFVLDTIYTYSYSSFQYPLEVGKSWDVQITETRTTNFNGQSTTDTTERLYFYEVEIIENITVPAGVFECFKIVQYDDTHSPLNTSWVSEETKLFDVKEIYHQSNESKELISCSFSD